MSAGKERFPWLNWLSKGSLIHRAGFGTKVSSQQ